MNETYFLGANSKNGFYSLYAGFPGGEADFLHIIKGGPGTGKSGFMRKIGKAAEAKGFDVQYVLCSGDPDSLDGVYIPELHAAWVDGTAPHVAEPGIFGVDSDYVNLGKFFKSPLNQDEKERAAALNRAYKALYGRAYGYISAAASISRAGTPELFGPEETAAIEKRIDGMLDRCLGRSKSGGGRVSKRFLSAVSCLGEYRLTDEIKKLCKLIYQFDNGFGAAPSALRYAAEGAVRRGAEVILCLSPIDPEQPEAVLLPQCGVAFAGSSWELDGAKHIHIDALVPGSVQQEHRRAIKENARLAGQALALGYDMLRRAKALHDELEAVYKPHMDFPALTRYTDSEIKKIFK